MENRKKEPNRPYAEMIAIFTISWLLVLVGAIIIFRYVVPFNYCNCSNDSILKGVFAVILSGVWLLAMILMRDVMVRRTILRRRIAAG